ncbi:glycosyltransferase family 4 protein [Corynebacterium sp. HMSC11E11]|uniref:glycosyltransferase family 4 protein n=1 Tax=Corynebacterium sp. HMSC11E11 TaxID=1581089 RepID=UPI0009F4DBEB|nr:glycosyltransferase family 4 protein [Corynebacterium sp. HMSC11E11]
MTVPGQDDGVLRDDGPRDDGPRGGHGRVLLITNDFPPRQGGIESYLRDFCGTLDPESLTVLASTRIPGSETRDHDAALPYRVHRLRDRVLLPLPHVARAAARIIAEEDIDVVWFGAAAPMGLLARACRRAGARRIISTTHGHEVGWSMLPVSRRALRIIGDGSDVVTYISGYTRNRFAAAFGPRTAFERLPSGVDVERFRPDPDAGARIRARHGIAADQPLIVCISRLVARKGQDSLIAAMPAVVRALPDARLVIVGAGPYEATLRSRAAASGVADHIIFTGSVPFDELPDHYNAATVFAMPARTRGGGLDVEGLGIVYLEAQACGVPVIAGESGGAPETVVDGVTGVVVDGRDIAALARAITAICAKPERARQMGEEGRRHVVTHWTWEVMGARLRRILAGDARRG